MRTERVSRTAPELSRDVRYQLDRYLPGSGNCGIHLPHLLSGDNGADDRPWWPACHRS